MHDQTATKQRCKRTKHVQLAHWCHQCVSRFNALPETSCHSQVLDGRVGVKGTKSLHCAGIFPSKTTPCTCSKHAPGGTWLARASEQLQSVLVTALCFDAGSYLEAGVQGAKVTTCKHLALVFLIAYCIIIMLVASVVARP